jgi:hypothetical protein
MAENDTAVPAVAVAVIVAGAALAFAAAVIPHFNAGYHLAGGVLFVALTPYVAYGALLGVLRRGPAIAAGLAVLAVNAAVIVPERLLGFSGYDDGWIYYAPLAATFVLLPLFLIGGRRRVRSARGAE